MSPSSHAAVAQHRPQEMSLFPPPYEAIRPFYDPRTQWGRSGPQEHLAYRTLKDHFPELSNQEVFLIVISARQLFVSVAG